MESSLSKIICQKLKASGENSKTLEQGLFDALEHQQKMQEMYINLMSSTEFRNEVTRILNSVEKINDALKNLGQENCQILDNVYYSAGKNRTTLCAGSGRAEE